MALACFTHISSCADVLDHPTRPTCVTHIERETTPGHPDSRSPRQQSWSERRHLQSSPVRSELPEPPIFLKSYTTACEAGDVCSSCCACSPRNMGTESKHLLDGSADRVPRQDEMFETMRNHLAAPESWMARSPRDLPRLTTRTRVKRSAGGGKAWGHTMRAEHTCVRLPWAALSRSEFCRN